MFRALLSRLYFRLADPLYRRLCREMAVAHQQMANDLLRLEENLTSTLGDELVRLHLNSQQNEEATALLSCQDNGCDEQLEPSPSDFQIGSMMHEIGSAIDIISVSRKWKVPVADIIRLESKYRGMDAVGVKRARKLEKENLELRRQLLEPLLKQNLTTTSMLQVSKNENGAHE